MTFIRQFRKDNQNTNACMFFSALNKLKKTGNG
jgi:hypothetical protein